MEYEDFCRANYELKMFFTEQDKLNTVLNVISPSTIGTCEFGNEFIGAYVSLMEKALGDAVNWYTWFVFENDFGNQKLSVERDGVWHEISDEKQFYDICITYERQKILK